MTASRGSLGVRAHIFSGVGGTVSTGIETSKVGTRKIVGHGPTL